MKAKILMPACFILVLSLWLSVTAFSFSLADSESTTSLEEADTALLSEACQPLPPPSGTIINVSTVNELQNAVNNATSGDTIRVADGVYNLDGVYLRMETPNVTLRSASGDRDTVILDGNYITTEIIQIVASDVTIADVTLREAYYHNIHVVSSDAGDTVNTYIYNVHIVDSGEQAIKINPAGENTYPDNGLIACSHIELTDAGRPHIRNNCYTGGIDAHQAVEWVIRDNLIEGFWCANGLSEHGIHLWRGCRDTRVERNVLNDNARGIGFGLTASGDARTYPDNPCPGAGGGYVDHYGGIIRNNFVFTSQDELFASEYGFDCGICLWQACGAQAFHNTVVSTEAHFSSIEWRFDNTDVEIKNNLVSHNIRDRGGTAVLAGNLENTPLALFVDGSNGDLHLRDTAAAAIDQTVALAEVTDDIDGDSRFTGAAPDIGADEYTPILTGSINGPLIIDHTCTDITKIPPYWLEQAKQLAIHYAHTSHGSQINSGILNLESLDSNYSVAIRTSATAGLPPEEDPPALRMYDGNPPETYINPGDYWDGTSGMDRTRAVADTGDYDFSMWSWCGQVSNATSTYIQSYLDALNQFESEYPDMRFILMTGHLDGSGSSGDLHIRNEQIRDFCTENNKVLFDFADIERYDPDGTDFLDLGADDECNYSGGNWADEWCAAHPGSDLCRSCGCAHSKSLNCNLKAGAFWWMMARLAGWNPLGEELAVDFGENGLWHYDGSWSKLTNWDPDDDLAGWSGSLGVDFGENGVWNNDGSSWSRITTCDAGSGGLAGWGSGLAVDFDGNGLWNYNGSWTKLTNWDPDGDMVGCLGGLWVDFVGEGLWNNDGASWSRITTWNVGSAGLACWSGGLAADFDGNGLWSFDGSAWRKMTNWDPENDLAGWPGGLAVDFGTNGLWSYDGASWTRLTTWDPGVMTGFADGLAVDFDTNGMWKYDGSSWSKLTNWDSENMDDVDLN